MAESIEQKILAREVMLVGDMKVKRALPFRARRAVGPFVFFDEMGPLPASLMWEADIPAHPHIGLSTITYLFDGEFLHRDSLGTEQPITPGAVNWMTAGSGIIHAEHILENSKATTLHGIQTWVALPADQEECTPSFQHVERTALPVYRKDGVEAVIVAGKAFDLESPVRVSSPLFYCDISSKKDATVEFDPKGQEAAFYLIEGEIMVDGASISPGTLVIFKENELVKINSSTDMRGMLLGGEKLPEPRHIYWNFVSSSRERIERAKEDWRMRRFPSISGETVFVPLPDEPKDHTILP